MLAMEDDEAKIKEMKFKTIDIDTTKSAAVAYIYLNRPAIHNALSLAFFAELPAALAALDQRPATRVIVLAARGPTFCSGIEIGALRTLSNPSSPDPARLRELLRRQILGLQSAVSALERCRKPVVAAIDGACFGGGIDLITACDIRYCTVRAVFSVMEVDLAITADLGTLQRLPRIVGFGRAAEMALTARRFKAAEAKEFGLVSQVFATGEEMQDRVAAICEDIASKPSLAVMGTKAILIKSRDLNVEQGLDYVATWNSGQILSHDLEEAMAAYLEKRKPSFSKL